MKMVCRLSEAELKAFVKQVIENLEPGKIVTDVNFHVSSTRNNSQENWTVSCTVEVENKGVVTE